MIDYLVIVEGKIMRTTLNLDDQLLISAKHRAIEERVSLASVVENALRDALAKPRAERKAVRLITASGPGLKPGVDLDCGSSMLDIMADPP